jgi:hypothetical protein
VTVEFIFMLTRNDRTVADAMTVYRQIADTDLQFVGFKDVGVTTETLGALTEAMHADGRTVFLEVVSTSQDDELRSIKAAIGAGVDYVLGGTHVDAALELLAGNDVKYCPFPGTVVGHPSELRGSVAEIADDARRMTSRDGVDGVDLLAYRHQDADHEKLVRAVVEESSGPVIVAGSIDREDRIRAMARSGAWAFTIGAAIFDNLLSGAPSLQAQVSWALEIGRQP